MANAVGSTAGLQQTHPDVEHASKTGGAVQRPGEPRDRDTLRQPHQARTRGDAAAAPVWGSNDSCPRWPPACPRPGMRTKWRRTKRRRRRSRRAWPNIWRLSIVRRSMCPSTGLVDQGKVPPALTAASSAYSPVAKRCTASSVLVVGRFSQGSSGASCRWRTRVALQPQGDGTEC